MIKRVRVVEVWGRYGHKGFVLEQTCSDTCMCVICKNAFWIQRVEAPNIKIKNKGGNVK